MATTKSDDISRDFEKLMQQLRAREKRQTETLEETKRSIAALQEVIKKM